MVRNKQIKYNTGFKDRIFLRKTEWLTFIKNMPVRYIRLRKKQFCDVCGELGREGDPLTNAHKIPFVFGIAYLGLTPSILNNANNIITAHRRVCNAKAELELEGCIELLKAIGIKKLPNYLPLWLNEKFK